jgi:hypothetical protein
MMKRRIWEGGIRAGFSYWILAAASPLSTRMLNNTSGAGGRNSGFFKGLQLIGISALRHRNAANINFEVREKGLRSRPVNYLTSEEESRMNSQFWW